jgi:hypothetical protein
MKINGAQSTGIELSELVGFQPESSTQRGTRLFQLHLPMASRLSGWLKYCGTSVAMIEKHYGKYLNGDSQEQLKRLFTGKTGTLHETIVL